MICNIYFSEIDKKHLSPFLYFHIIVMCRGNEIFMPKKPYGSQLACFIQNIDIFVQVQHPSAYKLAASCYSIEFATKTYKKTFTAKTKQGSGPTPMGIIALLLSTIFNTGVTYLDILLHKAQLSPARQFTAENFVF